MHLNTYFVAPVSVDDVLLRLHSFDLWPQWLHGQVEQTLEGVHLRLEGPPTVRVHMAVEHQPDGVRMTLLEGAVVSRLNVKITVHEDDEGARLTWDIEASFPLSVPGPLLREIDQVWVPKWSRALLMLTAGSGLETEPAVREGNGTPAG